MYHSRVLFRCILIMTITVLIFISIYSITPFLNRTPQARASGSMPSLQLPWPTNQSYGISGDSYGCGGHVTQRDADAIDFGLPEGSQVTAVAEGMAHFDAEQYTTGPKKGQYYDYGLFVWISHANQYVSLYAHLSVFAPRFTLHSQQWVHQGQLIGLSGQTGAAQGAHLHFSLRSGAASWTDGAAVKPELMSGYTDFGNYGIHGPPTGLTSTLFEHYDGQLWSIVSSPVIHNTLLSYTLISVTTISSTNVWAVSLGGFIEHWDGTLWSISFIPNSSLWAITATSAKDVWAVGENDTQYIAQPLVEHWDGTQWSSITTPPTPLQGGRLYGVTALSAYTVWVVGASTSGFAETLTELYS